MKANLILLLALALCNAMGQVVLIDNAGVVAQAPETIAETIAINPDIILLPKCAYNKATGSCSGKCGITGQCCELNNPLQVTGVPVCKCKAKKWCSNCQYQPLLGQCIDKDEICKRNGLGQSCCLLKWLGSSVPTTSVKYPVCFCQQNSLKCGNSCRFDLNKGKCFDATGGCSNKECCKYTGLATTGAPTCQCTLDLTSCSNCQFKGTDKSCTDYSNKCIGPNCCQYKSDGVKRCQCNYCPVPKCTWDRTLKKCYSQNKDCTGDNCCRPSGKLLTDGTPQCYCSSIKTEGNCDSCQYDMKNDKCWDTSGGKLCNGESCCQKTYFPGNKEFRCICDICKNTCAYNSDLLKCHDNTGYCSQNKCCSFKGTDQKGAPICSCTKDTQTCSNCAYNKQSTGLDDICADPSGGCNKDSNKCCQLTYFPTLKICQCKPCDPQNTCVWNTQKNQCYDPTGNCSEKSCCRQTGYDANKNPTCNCVQCQ